MKNKKMLAMLLALTVTAAGTPVYAADFSDGNLESVQEVAEPEKILTGDTALKKIVMHRRIRKVMNPGLRQQRKPMNLQKKMWLLHLRMTRRMKWQRRRVRIRKVEVKR